MKTDADGSFSDGFSTNVLPHAIAGAHIHIGTIAGKLNGVIPATTPTGWRIEYTSTPVDACSENSPFNSVGIPQANSITSRPRVTSPIASDSTLPCSATRIRAMSSLRACTSSRMLNISSARFASETPRHEAKAAFADCTARSTSSTDARSTAPLCRPVAGLKTLAVRPEVPGTDEPSIQWSIGVIAAPSESDARSPGADASSVMSAS